MALNAICEGMPDWSATHFYRFAESWRRWMDSRLHFSAAGGMNEVQGLTGSSNEGKLVEVDWNEIRHDGLEIFDKSNGVVFNDLIILLLSVN